jgi:hypothetical protein
LVGQFHPPPLAFAGNILARLPDLTSRATVASPKQFFICWNRKIHSIESTLMPPMFLVNGGYMKQSEIFRENAEHCAHLAEGAINNPSYRRYKRMEAAWWALAHEQDWLDGEIIQIRAANGMPVNMIPRE